MSLLKKERHKRARSFAFFKQQQHLRERDTAAANTIAFAFFCAFSPSDEF